MKRRNEVLVGVFVTVALIVGILGTLWLSRSGLLSDTYPLYTRFRWGANLKQGQEVWLAGFSVGTVDRVELRRDGWLDVWMAVEEKYEVPEGSIAQLKTASFFGDMAINLEPPLNFRSSVRHGDTIPAAPPPPTMDALLSRLDSVSRGVSDVARRSRSRWCAREASRISRAPSRRPTGSSGRSARSPMSSRASCPA
jgi:phospholipid/cholesterol/gamma-HCH transport system substrate-binding protein